MRKYINIIDENLTINAPKGFTWITEYTKDMILNGGKESIPLTMHYGDFEIWRNGNLFGIIKDNVLYGIAEIQNYKNNTYFLKRLETRKDMNTTDMAAAIFHYIIQDLSMSLLSDTVMSDKGNAFWIKMAERRQISVGILDTDTDEWYPIDRINSVIRNGNVKVLNPKDDLGFFDLDENDFKISREPEHYRFFWCAEGRGSHFLKEHLNRGHDREIVLFGMQEYPDYGEYNEKID